MCQVNEAIFSNLPSMLTLYSMLLDTYCAHVNASIIRTLLTEFKSRNYENVKMPFMDHLDLLLVSWSSYQ